MPLTMVTLHTQGGCKEVVEQATLNALWDGTVEGEGSSCGALRVIVYSLQVFATVQSSSLVGHAHTCTLVCGIQDALWGLRLTNGLQVLPNTIEMARVTGLAANEVLYFGQMARTWSMLLSRARAAGYVVGGPHTPANQESTQQATLLCRHRF